MRARYWLIALLALGFIFGIASSSWGVPRMINVQGRLLDNGGNPITTLTNVEFSIWHEGAAGIARRLWVSERSITPNSEGIFDIILGEERPILNELTMDGDYQMRISVGGESLSPWQPLVSVPFAITARNLRGGTVVARSSTGIGVSGITESTAQDAGIRGDYSTPDIYGELGTKRIVSTSFVAEGTEQLGVYGRGDVGVYGYSTDLYGIIGYSTQEDGIGVKGLGDTGVYGESGGGHGVMGTTTYRGPAERAGIYGESDSAIAVFGKRNADATGDWPAVLGQNYKSSDGINAGVRGFSAIGYGVYGNSNGTTRAGVFGVCNNSVGVEGYSVNSIGVRGFGATAGGSFESEGAGVYAINTNTTPNFSLLLYSPAVLGESAVGNGIAGVNNSINQPAIYGFNQAGGVAILGNGSTGTGVRGISTSGFGVSGNSTDSYGVVGSTEDGKFGVVGLAAGRRLPAPVDLPGFFYGVFSYGNLGAVGNAYFDGNVFARDYRAFTSLDIAEWIKVNDPSIEEGDVVVLNKRSSKSVAKSSRKESTLVAGIISTKPAFLAGNQGNVEGGLTNEEMEAKGYRMLALAGQVPTKVSTENGPIEIGDLLTTSNTPGHAMKAIDPKIGTIVGKAMEPLASGKEKIMVLLTLQ